MAEKMVAHIFTNKNPGKYFRSINQFNCLYCRSQNILLRIKLIELIKWLRIL